LFFKTESLTQAVRRGVVIIPSLDIGCTTASHWALCKISSV